MSHLEQLTEAVRKIEDAGDSLIATFRGIAQELRDFKQQTPEIEALAARLDAQAQELSDAVLENTPADPNA